MSGTAHDVRPRMVVEANAPIRVCDNGGWTDTWFAGHGQVFNIAMTPLVYATVRVLPAGDHAERVTIHARNFSDRYDFEPRSRAGWVKHPLLEAAVVATGVPDGAALEVDVWSDAPAGASVGTSASVTVALIAALDAVRGARMGPADLARAAHHVEMDVLGWQCGIQDQLCAAYGGINFIDMTSFPEADVTQLQVLDGVLRDLDRRLLLVYLGGSHRSSDIHLSVIRELEDEGPECRKLRDLRQTAARSRDAVVAGDLEALGAVMVENTEAQRRLHPALIGHHAQQVIDIARRHGAAGWKVNGAGGDGGSVTILAGRQVGSAGAVLAEITRANAAFKVLPARLSPTGVQVQVHS
jgi:D-glycero-alpha-D-manno-heptose-7-phosphate kinase